MAEESILLTPVKMGNRILPNRFAVNAMEGCDADEYGNPTDDTFARYEGYFKGKSAFIDLEAITCQKDHVSSTKQLSLMPENAKALEKFVSELKNINSDNVFVFQLTHSGEVSHPVLSDPVRVSEKPLYGFENARLIREEEMEKIMCEYETSAKIAHDAGADGIDLKLCTGYLGSQVLRPYNSGVWKYGGPWENRRRFAFDLIERITKAVDDPDFIIGSKISVYEGFPGGQGTAGPDSALMDTTETVDLIKGLEERGAKYFVETAGGPRVAESLSKPEGKDPSWTYMHHYFQKIMKDAVKPETVIIGSCYSLFRDGNNTRFLGVAPEENSLFYWGDKNIRAGICDMISLGRQSFADPSVPARFAEGTLDEVNWCTGCDNCSKLLIGQQPAGCIVYSKKHQEIFKAMKAK